MALNRKRVGPEACPALSRPLSFQAVYPVLDQNGAIRSTVTVETDPRRSLGRVTRDRRDSDRGCRAEPPGHIDPRYRYEPNFGLSDREIEVLCRIADGLTNVEIAAAPVYQSPYGEIPRHSDLQQTRGE